MYCSVYVIKLLITRFLTIFQRFPTIFRRFPKILKMLSGSHTNVSEHFPNFSENFRRLLKIAEEDLKMFRLNIDKLCLIQHLNMANSSANVTKSISSHVKDMTSWHM